MPRPLTIAFISLSGWCVAAFASFSILKTLQSRENYIQDYRDFSQIYYFLWEYARTHNGRLPNTLEEGLSGTGASEPYLGMFTLLAPGAILSELPGNTPILRLNYPRKQSMEVIMYPSGQIFYNKRDAEQGHASSSHDFSSSIMHPVGAGVVQKSGGSR